MPEAGGIAENLHGLTPPPIFRVTLAKAEVLPLQAWLFSPANPILPIPIINTIGFPCNSSNHHLMLRIWASN